MQLKLVNNTAVIDMVNNSRTTMFFTKQKGNWNCRHKIPRGYYNIQQCVLEYNLGAHYEFPNFNKVASVYEDMRLAKYSNEAERRGKEIAKENFEKKS